MTSVPFDIPINDDDIYEINENFRLTIDPNSLPPTGVTVGNPDQATVTIVDDDRKLIYFCHDNVLIMIHNTISWYKLYIEHFINSTFLFISCYGDV